MQVERTLVTVRMVVEAEVEVFNPEDESRIISDLTHESFAVKSGIYENRVWGGIDSVEIISKSQDMVEWDDDDQSDNTEGSLT